jgi:cell division protein FtsQ
MKLFDSKPGNNISRAEQSRQKRAQTSQQRATRVNHNVVVPVRRPTQPPPVTVRGASTGIPLHQKPRSKVRRQLYYSLGNTGAEVRLPAMPAFNPGWRIFSAAFVLVLFAVLVFVYNAPQFKVSSVKFIGLQRIKAEDIQGTIGLKNVPIFTVDPKDVTQKIEKSFPELTDIKVSVGLPAVVSIAVKERQPVMVWKYKDTVYWVDKDSVLIQPRGTLSGLVTIESQEAPPLIIQDIPLTAGSTPSDSLNPTQTAAIQQPQDLSGQTLDPTILKAALGLKKIIPSGTTLAYTSKNGLGWADPQGWNVYVGFDLDDIDLKMKMYQAVVQKLNQDEMKPVMISVENLHAPFYRLEP